MEFPHSGSVDVSGLFGGECIGSPRGMVSDGRPDCRVSNGDVLTGRFDPATLNDQLQRLLSLLRGGVTNRGGSSQGDMGDKGRWGVRAVTKRVQHPQEQSPGGGQVLPLLVEEVRQGRADGGEGLGVCRQGATSRCPGTGGSQPLLKEQRRAVLR